MSAQKHVNNTARSIPNTFQRVFIIKGAPLFLTTPQVVGFLVGMFSGKTLNL